MSKERLEEIKTRFNAMKELESFKKLAPTDLFFDDLNWLLQQAERVQELKKQSHGIELDLLNDEVVRLEQQNQRYKQALEFYANEKNYERAYDDEVLFDYLPSEIDFDNGGKARNALECEGRA